MSSAAPKRPSFEDLYAEIERLPEGVTGEILDPGVLVTMSRPGRAHRHTGRRVLAALRGFDQNEGGAGWWIEIEPEVRLGPWLLVPDLAGWRTERITPEELGANPIPVAPDWVCEVLSSTTMRKDRGQKLPRYARGGVRWVWMVDPAEHMVEVYETDAKGRPALTVTAEEREAITLPPFDGEFDVSEWWLREA